MSPRRLRLKNDHQADAIHPALNHAVRLAMIIDLGIHRNGDY